MTAAITTIWKKLHAAVFWIITGILAFIAWATHHEKHRGRHARPRPADEDAKTVHWFRRLHEQPARVMAAPFTMAVAWLGAFAAVTPRAQRTGWRPATGAEAMHVHAMRQQAMDAALAGPSHADLDQYLTEDAMRYPAAFDAAHRILDGEIAPPWIGPQAGDITLDAPMTYRPEPPIRPLPPARACPDVPLNVPTNAVLHILGEPLAEWLEHHTPEDVPGPAETASPPPPSGNGAEAALPPAVASAGPGTTRPDVDDLDNTGVMAALTDWALHAPLDQVTAVAR